MAETNDGARSAPPPAPRRGRCARSLLRFARDARGGTAIEYAMIGGLIFAVAAVGIRAFGVKTDAVYGRIGSAMMQIN